MTWTNSPYLKAVDERAEKATFRKLAPYAYSPCGYDDEDKAVSLDGSIAINPMPAHLANDVLAAFLYAEAARTDVPALSARVKELESALEFALDSLGSDQSVAHKYICAALATPPPEGDAP